jgi:hypothetical protein
MSKINWELVDRDTFADYRKATAEDIARAYVAENLKDRPNLSKIISLYEMGQGRFSENLNNRENREALFLKYAFEVARLWSEKASA